MNRACAQRLLAVPVLLWAALAATPAVADSCAYATTCSGDAATAARGRSSVSIGPTMSRGPGRHRPFQRARGGRDR
ncbi:hypothetical protein, partial [Streptomyces sp. NPDC041003]|uniref:hypothetical protein n=1 Tax=Streptomyces sp. NPDC041003 TaxID=3155730 RepID=UPI0033CA9FD1